MNLTPLGDRLLVEAISEDEISKAGIILPKLIQALQHGNMAE